MRTVQASDLKPGMVAASDILSPSGQRIYGKGTVLTEQLIMRLSFYRIASVIVEDSEAGSAPEKPAPSMSPAFALKLKSSQQSQTFQVDHSLVCRSIKESFEAYVNENVMPDTEALVNSVISLFNSCRTSKEVFDMLFGMRSSGEETYSHSLNVALICRQFGKWLKVSDDALYELTLCGLYHDIGKLRVPSEILNKPDKFTDEEFNAVKMHTQYGYELLKPLPLPETVKMSALSHHERCDGSGYPLGLREIDDGAMIVAIADVYDAMTAARSYRAPLCAFQVIDKFEQEGLQKYKPKYILTFLSHIASTYQNNRILLNDGRSGKIVMLNEKALSRPIVQLNDSSCIDLATQRSLYIKSLI